LTTVLAQDKSESLAGGGSQLPKPDPEFKEKIAETFKDSTPSYPFGYTRDAYLPRMASRQPIESCFGTKSCKLFGFSRQGFCPVMAAALAPIARASSAQSRRSPLSAVLLAKARPLFVFLKKSLLDQSPISFRLG
jgi:hypothetical protein